MRSPSQPIVKYSMETYGPVLPDVTLRTNATVEVLKGLNVDHWPQRLRGVHFGSFLLSVLKDVQYVGQPKSTKNTTTTYYLRTFGCKS